MSNGRRDDYDDRQHMEAGPPSGQTRQRERPPEPRCELIDPRRYHLPTRPTVNVEEMSQAMNSALSQGFNLLAPLTALQHVPRNYQIALRIVQFSMEGPWHYFDRGPLVSAQPTAKRCSNGTWYKTDGGGFALHKAPLRMLSSMVGMSITVERTDNGDVGRWAFKASGRTRNMDGQWRTTEASKEVDLRDGSPEAGAMSEAQLKQARINGGRVAEAKAVNAMIRDAIGLKGAYSSEEAARPFVFPCLVYEAPDDPQVRLLQAAVELGVVGQVFGPGASMGRLLQPAGTVIEGEQHDADPEPTPEPRQRQTPPAQRQEEPRQRQPEPQRKAIPQDAPRQDAAPQRERQREPVRQQSRREEPPPPEPSQYGWSEDD